MKIIQNSFFEHSIALINLKGNLKSVIFNRLEIWKLEESIVYNNINIDFLIFF